MYQNAPNSISKSNRHPCACSIKRSLKTHGAGRVYIVCVFFFFSGEGLAPRPFVRFGRVMARFFQLVAGRVLLLFSRSKGRWVAKNTWCCNILGRLRQLECYYAGYFCHKAQLETCAWGMLQRRLYHYSNPRLLCTVTAPSKLSDDHVIKLHPESGWILFLFWTPCIAQ
jgi:hypothetical protein